MPKILIREKDYTTSGTPGDYSNYSVLIAGFQKELTDIEKLETELETWEAKKAEAKAKPDSGIVVPTLSDEAVLLKNRRELIDSNGVYEFSSYQAFEDTIGLVAPKHVNQPAEGSTKTFYHYGNQMAYELLKMDYKIIYKPVTSIDDIFETSFWEDFKDKASYDFRFVTHGLLTSDGAIASVGLEAAIEDLKAKAGVATYLALKNIYDTVAAEQNRIESAGGPSQDFDAVEERQTLYEKIITKYELLAEYNHFDDKENAGETIEGAYTAISKLADKDIKELKKKEAELESLNKGQVTTDKINLANLAIADLAMFKSDDNAYSELDIPGRGDCVALIELDEAKYVSTTATDKPEALIVAAMHECNFVNHQNGPFCAMTVPSVVYKRSDSDVFENNKKFPGAFHYLACFKNSLSKGFREWYAAAGYTRGVSDYTIDYTTAKLGEVAINTLEPRYITDSRKQPKFACNVIANFRGSYYLWGNRTATPLEGKESGKDLVAKHFLNIRHLCTTIKKQLYVACRRFTFDPNSDTLWYNFIAAIKPTLEVMKADQGVRDYKILKVFTDKKATLKAKVRIVPIEAVEDFDIEIALEDSISGATVTVNE